MIVICEECGKKYRIDPQKIKGSRAGFACTACNHRITVTKPKPGKGDRKADLSAAGTEPGQPQRSTRIAVEDQTPGAVQQQPPAESAPTAASAMASPKKNRFGLTEKMVSLMLAVTLLPLILFWGITFKQTNERIQADSEKLMVLRAERLAGHIDEWIGRTVSVLKVTAVLPAITSMESQLQQPVLEAVAGNYPEINVIFTVTDNGRHLARSDHSPTEDDSRQPYFRDIIAGKDSAWQTLAGATSKKPVLVLAVPIQIGGKIVGALVGVMDIHEISRQIIDRGQGPTGIAFLTDTAGKVLAHRTLKYALERKDLSRHPLIASYKSGNRGLISFADEEGKPFLGYAQGTVFGWVLALQAEEREIFHTLKQTQFFAYIYLGAIMLLVIGIAFIVGKTMTRPIRELTDAADRISVGELDVEIKIKRKDEIGDLAEAVIRMQDSLRLSIERLRRRR